MAEMPTLERTVDRIYRTYTNVPPRCHLGASVIGRECERQLWYAFRWCVYPSFEGRMIRLFKRGQREETEFITELRAAGVQVHDRDPDTGRQFTFTDCRGHFGGSCDGLGLGFVEAPKAWHVLEFKTHGAKSFGELETKGVERAKPEHAIQCQCYMGWSGIDRAFYLAVNKDTDELYQERVKYDADLFAKTRTKAARVVDSAVPLVRMSERPEFWKCKCCESWDVCHGGKVPPANCRTCIHSTPVDDGKWKCSRDDRELKKADQLAACPKHIFIPPLIPAESVTATEHAISYRLDNGRLLCNVADVGFPVVEGDDAPIMMTSQELQGRTLAKVGME